jgi:hypothetical protein
MLVRLPGGHGCMGLPVGCVPGQVTVPELRKAPTEPLPNRFSGSKTSVAVNWVVTAWAAASMGNRRPSAATEKMDFTLTNLQ